MNLLYLLKDPLTKDIKDINDENTYLIHRKMILNKPFLFKIYEYFYGLIFKEFKSPYGKDKILEIGAGGFNGHQFNKNLMTSDLHKTEFVTHVEDAQNLSFQDGILDGITMIDVLHHIPKPNLFFKEALRTLKPDGKVVMIEPFYGPWGSLVYKNLHHEPYYDIESWDIPLTDGGRLSDANMMMPHNIFIRDISKFKTLYPEFQVEKIKKINFFSYLISGGLSYRSMLPGFMAPILLAIEEFLSPALGHLFGMHMLIVLRKKN